MFYFTFYFVLCFLQVMAWARITCQGFPLHLPLHWHNKNWMCVSVEAFPVWLIELQFLVYLLFHLYPI